MGMIGSAQVDLGHNKTGLFEKMLNKRECIEYGSNRGPDVPKSERVKTVIYAIYVKTLVAAQTRTTDLPHMSKHVNQLS